MNERTRTSSAAGLIGALLLIAGACASTPDSTTLAADSPPVTADYGVVAAPPLPTTAPVVAFDPSVAIASADGGVVVDLAAGLLTFRDGATDEVLAETVVGIGVELRAVGADGTRAALFERTNREDDDWSRITTVELAGDALTRSDYELRGLVEPEAFSTDGAQLFAIDHQVSGLPGAYRVRPLDLETGLLQTIVGPTKAPFVDDMNGTGRRQMWSSDGSRLYTLYVRQTHHHHADGRDHAHGEPGTDGFVHVLDLDEEWAFCLDLPPAFGAGDLATTALAVSPDGTTIAVADMTAGQVAFASTQDLEVTRVADLPSLAVTGELHLGLTRAHLAIGWGSEVHWLDRETLEPVGEPEELKGTLMGFTPGPAEVFAWTEGSTAGPRPLRAPSA